MSNPEIVTIDNRTLPMGNNDTRIGVLASGNVAVLGQLLGFITTGQKLANAKSGSVDGSEFARVVAAGAVDASGGDLPITFYIKGDLDDSQVVFDGGDDFDTVVAGQEDTYRTMLRDYGILANTYKNDQVIDNS